MTAAKITAKGQITLPKAIRGAMGVQIGDRVSFEVQSDGTVTMASQKGDIRDLASIRPTVHGVSIADMDAAIIEGATE